MYNICKKTGSILLIFLAFAGIAFPITFDIDAQIAKIDNYTLIQEAFPIGSEIYVLGYTQERIHIYDHDLDKIADINQNRQFVRDLIVERENGIDTIYTVQSLSIFRVVPRGKVLYDNVFSTTSFIKVNESFYTTHYYGGVSKWYGKNDSIQKRDFKSKFLPAMHDLIYLNNKIYALGEDAIYIFNESLNEIEKCALDLDTVPTGLSYYDGSLLISSGYKTLIYSPDCINIKNMSHLINFTKIYVLSPNKLLGFNDNAFMLLNGTFESLNTTIENNLQEFENYTSKLNNSEHNAKIGEIKIHISKDELGQAYLLLNTVNLTKLHEEFASINDSNTTTEPPKNDVDIAETDKDKSDQTTLVVLAIASLLIIAIFISYLFKSKHSNKKKYKHNK